MNRWKHILIGLAASQFVSPYAVAGEVSQEIAPPPVNPEIQALRSETTHEGQQALIRTLVLRVGPEAAQDELYRSGLPFTGETHLVIHAVGSLLYEKFGTKGIAHCRPYFAITAF
jgi:hypothetical protein